MRFKRPVVYHQDQIGSIYTDAVCELNTKNRGDYENCL